MNKNAKKWVDALLSGKYRRTEGLLAKRKNGRWQYCCLGVACELYKREHPKFEIKKGGGRKHYEGEGEVPPLSVRNWLGLYESSGSFDMFLDEDPEFSKFAGYTSLAELNDAGASFSQVARFIQKYWKDL